MSEGPAPPAAEPPVQDFAVALRRLPWRTMVLLGLVGLTLAAVNHLLHRLGFELDTPNPWFPVSVFWARFHSHGWPWLLLFGGLTAFALLRGHRFGPWGSWGLGLGLVLAANLIQGGPEAAFLEPLTEETFGVHQYYHDALEVEDAGRWLGSFNAQQEHLGLHARTHPPFAVLLPHLLLRLGGVKGLSFAFILAASLTLPILWAILGRLGADPPRRALLVLLLAAIPAFNVYAAVTLDGVVAATSTLFLLGLVRFVVSDRDFRRLEGGTVAALAGGFLLTQALTFAGVFLLAVLVPLAAWERWRYRRWDLVFLLGGLLLLAALVEVALHAAFGYDHLQALLTATRLEHLEASFRLAAPLGYLATRVESVCEIGLFLSLPALAVLLTPGRRGAFRLDSQGPARILPLAAVATVAAMLIAGAFRTGETARICLFLYPYLLLPLADRKVSEIRALLLLAALQTAAMQLVGDFFW
ncbi:MAG: hypothetical protein KDD47_23950 [Acidobacteria bacterium]|nr:hypothetical protein [Acidobacteriota bacterium]